jgi:hypothetical protein
VGVESRAFKWVALVLAASATAIVIWMMNDVRREMKHTNAIVNEHLPPILANANKATETMARVSKDIDAMRDLGGLTGPKDRSLAAYADGLLDLLEKQTGKIGLEKVIGKELKDLVPIQEWVAAARKEALWLTFRASSKADLLDRLSKNKLGSHWMLAPEGGPPQKLVEFWKANHAESAKL